MKIKKAGTVEGDGYTCEYDDEGMICWGYDEEYGDWYCVMDFETEEYFCDYGFAASMKASMKKSQDYSCEEDGEGNAYCSGYCEEYGQWDCAFYADGTGECWGEDWYCWGTEDDYECEYGMMEKAGTVEGDGYTCEYDDYGMVCWGWDEDYGDWYCVFDFETEEYACDYGFAAAMKTSMKKSQDYSCEEDTEGNVFCYGDDADYGEWSCAFYTDGTGECWGEDWYCWGTEDDYDCDYGMMEKAGTVEGDGYTCEYDDEGMVCWGYDEEYGNWYCVFDFETEEYACDYGFVALAKSMKK